MRRKCSLNLAVLNALGSFSPRHWYHFSVERLEKIFPAEALWMSDLGCVTGVFCQRKCYSSIFREIIHIYGELWPHRRLRKIYFPEQKQTYSLWKIKWKKTETLFLGWRCWGFTWRPLRLSCYWKEVIICSPVLAFLRLRTAFTFFFLSFY